MSRTYYKLACNEQNPSHVVGGNLTVVKQMLDQFHKEQPKRFVKPASDTLVIHLRLGDVIEDNGHVFGASSGSSRSVPQLLSKGGDPAHTSSFRSSIKSFYEYLSDIQGLIAESNKVGNPLRSVTIVGGSHRPEAFQKSRLYAGCLERAIRAATRLPVTLHIGDDPDADFYFMAHAKYLTVSAGGYSRLIGDFVQFMGGEVIGRVFHDTTELRSIVAGAEERYRARQEASPLEKMKHQLRSFALSLIGK